MSFLNSLIVFTEHNLLNSKETLEPLPPRVKLAHCNLDCVSVDIAPVLDLLDIGGQIPDL